MSGATLTFGCFGEATLPKVTPIRCPNVAEYLVTLRIGGPSTRSEHWVCGSHVEWYGRRNYVLRRATPDHPATETESTIREWGPADE